MKKIIAFILCLCLCLPVTAVFAGEYDNSIARVCGIGVMGNVADGDFRADDNITRAEFTAVALRLLGIFSSPQASTEFTDVPYEHWASGHIATASSLGFINGRGNGIFAPEDNVTYPEAVKILVCVLGRDVVMENQDYPQTFLAEAGKLGITKGVEYTNSPLTRAQVAALADNALDVRPLELIYGTNNYESSEYTLFEKLSLMKDTSVLSGILEQSAHFSLDFTPEFEKGFVVVDGIAFKTDKDYDSLIGQSVDVYYTQSGNVKTAVYIASKTDTNKIFVLPSDETYIADKKIYYTDESGKEKTYNLSEDCAFLVNGDRLSLPGDFSLSLGDYTLVDNDGNKSIDTLIVKSAESYIVKSVSDENSAVYFDNNCTYHGRGGFAFDYDNEDKEYVIEDKDGNEVSFDYIEPGDSVSFVGNTDDSFVTVIVNKETLSGKIDEMSESKITVSGKTVPIGKDNRGNYIFTPYIGMEGDFAIDAFGYCIGSFGSAPDKFTYGYIADATKVRGIGSSIKIKIVTGTEPKRNVKVSNGDETVSYYLQNDDTTVYTLADTIRFGDNPTDATGTKLSSANLDPAVLVDKIAGFTFDSEGKINALNIYSMPANFSSYEFNADIFSFGGIRASRGFVKDESTVIVCVPNLVRTQDDFGVRVQITDETNVKVYGIKGIYENEYGSEYAYAEPMDIIVVKADMDSKLPPTISEDDEICIVGTVSLKLSEDGDEVCSVELLRANNKETYIATTDSPVYSAVKKLRKGDLIRFATNSQSEIVNVRKLASVQGLTEYTDEENLYGIIEDVKYDVYDYLSNSMIDRITVNSGNNLVNVKLYKSEGQNIYLYERKSGYIYPASSSDIMAESYYGANASKVFAYMTDNEAEVIVLIKD